MERKKSDEANIEKLRLPLFLMGLLFIGSIVLASFTYQSGIDSGDDGDSSKRTADVNIEKVKVDEKQEDETPPPPPEIDVPPPPSEETKTKDNTNDTVVKNVVAVQTDIKIGNIEPPKVVAEIIDFPDVEASFPGGAAELQKWIIKNVRYPPISIENNEQGKVFVSFVVEPDGKISGVQVERGISDDLDKEAKRLVRSMPAWVPGEAGGKKARVRCRLPINFQLN